MMTAVDNDVRIINYKPEHRTVFQQLNYEWISRYFTVEETDSRMLEHPEEYILGNGGFIFMASWQGTVVGTCALIRINQRVFELAKMAVADEAKGKGIGYALGMACIAKMRELGVQKLELLSNTLLEPAINLYRKLGFKEVPLPQTEYLRANIKMEINLQDLVKTAFVIADDLPVGLAINTAAVLGASLGNSLPYMIGESIPDASGLTHGGLTWITLPILKATRADVKRICMEAKQQKGLLVIDLPEAGQTARTYDTWKEMMKTMKEDELQYCGVVIYGDKSVINKLTGKLSLYR